MSPSSSLVLFLRQRVGIVKFSNQHHHINFVRQMGGGPRTFPGGLSKWKYRRMHEKLAREKERKLLNQEKEIYQARLRTEIRAEVGAGYSSYGARQLDSLTYGPLTSNDHIKVLADRFMKDGAEDLWNEDDGPLQRSAPEIRPPSTQMKLGPANPIGVRKLTSSGNSGSNSWSNVESFYQRRGYSSMVRKLRRGFYNSDSDSDSNYSLENSDSVIGDFGNEKVVSEGEQGGRSGVRKKMISSAALRGHDKKNTERVKTDLLEKITADQELQGIREDFEKRRRDKEAQREDTKGSIFTTDRFDACNISPLTIKALNSAGYEKMTLIQAEAIPICLDGKDTLVKAKSGTGKSIAFLIPTIEAVLKALNSKNNRHVHSVFALILCPTRELACQVTAEANVLLRHHTDVRVQTLIGGTRFKVDQKLLESNPPQIVVATPGRLLDHIENKSGFSVRLMGLKVLVIDEVDHLLDLGFRSDIEKIIDCLPQQRQSLLFSATIPKEVRRISQLVLNKDHVVTDTVNSAGSETPDQISQSYIVAPHEDHFQIIYHLLRQHIVEELEYKVILFCTTAMVTSLMYAFLRNMKLNAREIHSRKSQLFRTRISDEFRESKRLILVTSDVSSRGMDYPDVTLVLQVGIPTDREQYIHRLGRTGRKGKDGKGILLLAPWEEHFVEEIKNLPIEKSRLPEFDLEIKSKVEASMLNIDTGTKEAAYHAWLGYYNSISDIGRDKTNLVELANKFCLSISLQKPPPLFRKTALKMGLKDIPGIKIKK